MELIGKDTDEIRTKWVIEQLKALPPGKVILDAGAGELRFKSYCDHLDYVSQDFGKYEGGGDGTGLQTGKWDNTQHDIVCDITHIPRDDESFDVVLCSEVFEHIPDAIAALRELIRVLKPGGTLLITAPFSSLTHFAPYHFCGYNRYWYMHHLPKMGVEIKAIVHNGSWFAFVAQELRRSRMVGKMYSSEILGLFIRIYVVPLLFLLTFLSKRDRGSEELLCFGYMVRGKKMA